MFKDYDKYLSASLKVYLIVLVFTFILKIVGLNYFGLDLNNEILINISSFLKRTHLLYLFYFITLYIMFYIYLSVVCKNKKVKLVSFVSTLIELIIQIFLMKINKSNELKYIVDFTIMIVIPMIINKKVSIKRQIIMIFVITLYQLISYSIRNQKINNNLNCELVDILLNIDQYILLIITYKIYFMKGGFKLCQEVGYSSLKKINLKKLLKRLQENFHNFKKKPKVERLTIIIYSVLSLIWNALTILAVMLIAKLNRTFVECIFILTSFWLSKRIFGKAFHLSSMIQCFIVSNLTYYVLNRITTPVGISIIIPIMLGVGLSYVTSKLVKKQYKPLYKGMPEDTFEETITKVVDKGSTKYNICYDFYILGKSDLSSTFKYNYSIDGIRKIRNRVNDKIKRL